MMKKPKRKLMSKFGIIDTETTWGDAVMSIGLVIADSQSFKMVDKRYFILTPFKDHGGMFSHALYANGVKPDLECSRKKAITEARQFLGAHDVESLFAYNASFDDRHLPELSRMAWHDILKVAAYKQHNRMIPDHADCFGTGRLKSGYGVEMIYRLLSGNPEYSETHNALLDAIDELEIMRLLGHGLEFYSLARLRR
jgi:hypothetical protein